MQLDLSTRQLLRDMPDLAFGEDQRDYTRRVLAWAAAHGYPTMQAANVARIKWQAWEVENLLERVEGGSDVALREAVVMLLKDRYIV